MNRYPERKRPVHFPGVERGSRAVIYFVTVCTQGRRRVLACDEVHGVLRRAWDAAGSYRVGRYVLMPDHLHLFCSPGEFPPPPLKLWMRFWRTLATKNWPGGEENVWQREYWDTQLRRREGYSAKWEYVRQNPVRAGLVGNADAWAFQGEICRLEWHD